MKLVRLDPARDLGRLRSFLEASDPHDYLLEDIAAWVREGRLWVGEESDRWVAFGRIHDLGDGQAWVSGLRVEAASRGRGVGGRFLGAVLSETRRAGQREFRAVIEATNVASQRLFGQQGFRSLFEMALRCGKAEPSGVPALRRAEPGAGGIGTVGWIPGRVGRVDLLPGTEGGRFGRWDPGVLRRWSQEGKLYVGPELAAAVQVDWQREPPTMWVNPLQGEPQALLPAIGRLAHDLGQEQWQSFLPSTEELRSVYRGLGLKPHPYWGDRVHLYERIDPPPSVG